jgi:peroxiredoxin
MQGTLSGFDKLNQEVCMYKKALFGVLAAAVIGVTPGLSLADTAIGKPAPDFTLPDPQGKTHSLSSQKGKYVVLEWFNEGCPFVRKHYDSGNMQKLQSTYMGKGVVWYSILSSAPGKEGYAAGADAAAQVTKNKMQSTALLLDPDGKAGRAYGAKTTPHMYIIDPKGTLIYRGGIDDKASADAEDIAKSRNHVQQALDEALAGKPVSMADTKPYGCGVKYK